MGISTSTYYYKSKVDPIERAKFDTDLRDRIEKIHVTFPGYGYRRIYHHLLKREGLRVNSKRIRRVMKEFGLRSFIKKKFSVSTTDSNHKRPVYPNHITGMCVTGINQIWVTDITYIRILTGFIYLAVIMDLYSRRAIGWAISTKIDTELCLAALVMALEERDPKTGLIHHSDRGVQYASQAYTEALQARGIIISMSGKGNPYDNAFMESFFKTLKSEEVYLGDYETMTDVVENLPRFIDDVYNMKRLHSGINYKSPVEFELELKQMDQAKKPILII